eukprot:gene1540-638_t
MSAEEVAQLRLLLEKGALTEEEYNDSVHAAGPQGAALPELDDGAAAER